MNPYRTKPITKPCIFFWFFLLFFSPACQSVRSLGKNPSGEELAKIEALPNYKNGAFQNLEDVARDSAVTTGKLKWYRLLKFLVSRKPANTRPAAPVPAMLTNLCQSYAKPTVIWFGHSTFLLKTATATLLFDPNLNSFAGPFNGSIKAFDGTMNYTVKDLPPIDALVVSHDHYDHLDYKTVRQLKKKVKRVIVPIGVGSHFRKWGYDQGAVTELNWNDSTRLNERVTITATPAHHRSNRSFAQRKTLWASYVIEADGYKLYFSGDTGYSLHFQRIGQQYGPFDLALLECGQYNQKWSRNHMFPYQTARAAVDLKAATVIPVHWARFAESEHPWNEPVKQLLASADSLQVSVKVPLIGQPYVIGEPFRQMVWWNF